MRSAHAVFSFLKSLLLSLLVLTTVCFSYVPFVHAQTTNEPSTQSSDDYLKPNTNADVPASQHTLIQSLTIEMIASGICLLAGVDLLNPTHQCLTVDPQTNKLGYAKDANGQPLAYSGAIGFTTNMIAGMYQPVASSGDYIHYMSSKFGLTTRSYAQNFDAGGDDANGNVTASSTGFVGLKPLIPLWLYTRNLSYMLFIIAFVVIGFGIMVRFKIDPRTTMSIQNQIPRIIIALILITFSYAIVGFMIDLMWTATYAGINIATDKSLYPQNSTTQKPPITDDTTAAASSHIFDNPISFFSEINRSDDANKIKGISGITKDAAGNLGDIVRTTVGNLLGTDNLNCSPGKIISSGLEDAWNNTLPGKIIPIGANRSVYAHKAFGPVGECAALVFNSIVFWISGFLAFFIILIAIFIALFRVWFMLIKAYAYIIFDTVVAPLWITAGLFPGSTLNFMGWFRHLAAHLIIFPVTVIMFLLVRIVGDLFNTTDPIFVPPLIGNPNIGRGVGSLLGIGLLFFLPEMLNIIRDAVKSPQSKYASAIGRGFQSGAAPAMAGMGKAWGRLTRPYNYQSGEGAGPVRSWIAGRPNEGFGSKRNIGSETVEAIKTLPNGLPDRDAAGNLQYEQKTQKKEATSYRFLFWNTIWGGLGRGKGGGGGARGGH